MQILEADIAVIGGGPAGLMAAESALGRGLSVHLFEAKGSCGRKFLLAGKGGLNLTHSEPAPRFLERYGSSQDRVAPWIRDFDADALRGWARKLGVETVVGSSGRVFPEDFKAAPLLRAWLRRLREAGLRIHVQHRWKGWDGETLCFDTPQGEQRVRARRTVLALGGASWPVLGSDGAWVPWLAAAGAGITPLRPANVGYCVAWSDLFRQRFAGQPIKPVAMSVAGGAFRQGELMVADYGLEGSLMYALGQSLSQASDGDGVDVDVELNLIPGADPRRLREVLRAPRQGRSLSEVLRRRLGLGGVRAALLRECLRPDQLSDADTLAAAIVRLPLRLGLPRGMDEAISSAGGVRDDALGADLSLRCRPDVYCAGEMLDWDAPTGGYLLTACFASGRHAGLAARRSLEAAHGTG